MEASPPIFFYPSDEKMVRHRLRMDNMETAEYVTAEYVTAGLLLNWLTHYVG